MSRTFQRRTSTLLIVSLLVGPLGCGPRKDGEPVSIADRASQLATDAWTVTRDTSTGAWNFVSDKSTATWVVMTDAASVGGDAAWDASKSAMLWTKDTTQDGWEWITLNVVGASEWAADSTTSIWKVTQEKSGEFFLWVKVEAEAGVAYVRTAVPAAWKVTKDTAGETWVWVNEHKVEAAVAATVVTLVVTGLIIEPVSTSGLLAKGVLTRAGAEFLTSIYRSNQDELGPLTEEEFVSIGTEVIKQNGENAERARQ